MKRIKYIISFVWLFFGACASDDVNVLEDVAVRGGFAQFVDVDSAEEQLNHNLLELETLSFSTEIIDPNNNIERYSLTITDVIQNQSTNDFVVIEEFPGTIAFDFQMIRDAFPDLETEDIDLGYTFEFQAVIETPTGIYTGNTPEFNPNSEAINTGGNTNQNLFLSGLKDAMFFELGFFLPPPDPIRFTSFEEPQGFGAGVEYIKDGGATESEDLINHQGEPSVDYVAVGSGAEDEIGFDTQYVDTGSSGFTNEEIGVTTNTSDVGGAFFDGDQGFKVSDSDGNIRIQFDRVEVPEDIEFSGFQIYVYAAETGFESNDFIRLSAEVEYATETSTFTAAEISDNELEDISGKWTVMDSGLLTDVQAYTVIVEIQSSSNSEDIVIDNLLVYKL